MRWNASFQKLSRRCSRHLLIGVFSEVEMVRFSEALAYLVQHFLIPHGIKKFLKCQMQATNQTSPSITADK